MRLIVPLVILGALFGCQEPFGTDRHYLVGDRVAAILVDPEADALRLRALVVEDGTLWQDEAVELSWDVLPDGAETADGLDPDDADQTGPVARFPLPDAATTYALVARFPSGTEWRAVVPLAGVPTPLPVPSGLVAETLSLDALEATPEELDREARLDTPGAATATLSSATWSRITVDWADGIPEALTRTRWSATPEFGTFLELDEVRTDWSPARLEIDELEIEEADPIASGPLTFLALTLDDAGGTQMVARDLWMGTDEPTGVRVSGRHLTTSASPPAGARLRGTLARDDTSPSGLRLDAVEAVTELDDDDPFGTEGLDCTDVAGPFDPNWLFDGRCLRGAVDGATVVVEVDP